MEAFHAMMRHDDMGFERESMKSSFVKDMSMYEIADFAFAASGFALSRRALDPVSIRWHELLTMKL